MTIIAAIAEHGCTHVASDDRLVDDRGSVLTTVRKTFAAHGALFGFSGNLATFETVRDTPLGAPEGELEDWLRRVVVPAWRAALKALDRKQDAEFLAASRGRLWLIGEDGVVIRIEDGRYAIGSGSEFARGALHAMRWARPAEALVAALDAAQAHVPTCGPGRRIERA